MADDPGVNEELVPLVDPLLRNAYAQAFIARIDIPPLPPEAIEITN